MNDRTYVDCDLILLQEPSLWWFREVMFDIKFPPQVDPFECAILYEMQCNRSPGKELITKVFDNHWVVLPNVYRIIEWTNHSPMESSMPNLIGINKDSMIGVDHDVDASFHMPIQSLKDMILFNMDFGGTQHKISTIPGIPKMGKSMFNAGFIESILKVIDYEINYLQNEMIMPNKLTELEKLQLEIGCKNIKLTDWKEHAELYANESLRCKERGKKCFEEIKKLKAKIKALTPDYPTNVVYTRDDGTDDLFIIQFVHKAFDYAVVIYNITKCKDVQTKVVHLTLPCADISYSIMKQLDPKHTYKLVKQLQI